MILLVPPFFRPDPGRLPPRRMFEKPFYFFKDPARPHLFRRTLLVMPLSLIDRVQISPLD